MLVNYAVVFQKEELQEEAVLEDLKKYGEVIEHYDDELVSNDGDRTPVMIVIVQCSIGKGFALRMDYNCVEAEDNRYVLFPMENSEEKRKILQMRGAL